MGRVCKLSKTAIKNYISSLDGKLESLFEQEISRLRYNTDEIMREGERFITWANDALSRGEAETLAVIRACEEKLSSAQYKKEDTPATIKKEAKDPENARTPNGQTKGKSAEVKEVRNPERDRLENACNELRGMLDRSYHILEEHQKRRREIEYYEDNLNNYLNESERVAMFLMECRDMAKKHIEALREQAEHAYYVLCEGMDTTNVFPEMKVNDGHVDIDGAHSYCLKLGEELDAIEQDIVRLQKTSESLRGSWSDGVYEYFNDFVQIDASDSLRAAVCELSSIKDDLEQMCARLEEYYDAPAFVDFRSVSFSYTYFSLEKGIAGTADRYYDF